MVDAWLNLERMEGMREERRGTRLKRGVRAGRQAIIMARLASRPTGGLEEEDGRMRGGGRLTPDFGLDHVSAVVAVSGGVVEHVLAGDCYAEDAGVRFSHRPFPSVVLSGNDAKHVLKGVKRRQGRSEKGIRRTRPPKQTPERHQSSASDPSAYARPMATA